MAKLGDVPIILRNVGAFTFFRRVWREVGDDHLLTWGAALAYSWLFSVFPFLIFLLTLIPHLPEQFIQAAHQQIPDVLMEYLAEPAARAIWENIKWVISQPQSGLLSIGILVTIWAASGGVNMTMTALDRCYEIEKGRPFWKKRLIAIGITLIVATLIIAVLILIPIGNLITAWILDHWPTRYAPPAAWVVMLWNLARYALALLLMITVVSVMYNFGIAVKQRWRVLSPGAIFTIAVWILLGLAFRWYVNHFGKETYNRTYGTVGGVAVLLLFFYLDALVLMIGAEINSEIDYEIMKLPRGSRDFRYTGHDMFTDASQPAAPHHPQPIAQSIAQTTAHSTTHNIAQSPPTAAPPR